MTPVPSPREQPSEREWLEGLRYDDKFPDVQEPEPCPMGCGRTTDDVYGGPCSQCWDAVEPGADRG